MSQIAKIGMNLNCRLLFFKNQNNIILVKYESIRSLFYSKKLQCSTAEKVSETSEKSDEKEFSEEKKQLIEKIDKLNEECSSIKDKYLRTLADGENMRHRLEKQISDSKLYGIQSFSKDLLEVSDVLRKAIENQPASTNSEIENHYKGMALIEGTLLSTFQRHGLQKISPSKGDKFDPSFHEAVFQSMNDGTHTQGTIAEIIRSGWKLHNRCIRSSQVGVFKEKA